MNEVDEVDYATILTARDGGVVTITLNRPEVLNAVNWRVYAELGHALAHFEAQADVRAIVVTGAGRAFCAGMDLTIGADPFRGYADTEVAEHEAVLRRLGISAASEWDLNTWDRSTPVLAAINGAAVGGGLSLPMQWDIRIAAEDAKLGFVFNRRGVLPEANTPWIVPRLVGLGRGLELLLTGRIITGEEAAAIGLVSAAVPAATVLDHTLAIAHDIAENVAPASAAALKRSVYLGCADTDPWAAYALSGRLFTWLESQPDAVEGPRAFMEKRPPTWTLSKHDVPDHLFES